MNKFIAAGLLGLLSLSTQAHVVLDNPAAVAGSYYRGALRVGHGCEGSPVKEVIVTIPDGVQGAKPMPKAGWAITIERKLLTKPYTSHGRTVNEDVSEIRWAAKTADDYLPDSYFDEFVVFAKLPEMAGKLYWKVSQICEQGRVDWNEIPTINVTAKLKSPAAVLDVQEGMAGHEMHKH